MDKMKPGVGAAAVSGASAFSVSAASAGLAVAAAAGSASLLLLSFPPFDAGALAFAALVPVLLVVYVSSPVRALAAGVVCGFLFFCLHLYWVNAYFPVIGVMFVTVVYGGSMAACFILLNLAAKAFPSWKAVITPFVWVAVEYGRSFGFLGTTFGSLGYTQHSFRRLIQIADIGGEPFVSFIVVFFNACLAQLVLSSVEGGGAFPLLQGSAGSSARARSPKDPSGSSGSPAVFLPDSRFAEARPPNSRRRTGVPFVAAAASLLAASLVYGTFKLKEPLPEEPSVRLALIQALSSPRKAWKDEKWDTLTRLIALTEESVSRSPDVDLVVWTETAIRTSLGPNLAKGTPYHVQIRDFVKRHRKWFIIGSPDIRPKRGAAEGDTQVESRAVGLPSDPDALSQVNPDARGDREWTNSAYYLGPDGTIAGTYDKIKLTPFGEHFPLGRRFPFLQRAVDRFTDSAGFTPGRDFTVFRGGKMDFGVVICWEGMYPYLIRRFVLKGAQFIVNISNDMWTNTDAAHLQHFTVTKFRAVENRIWFVRAANDGVTAFVSPRGDVTGILPMGKEGSLVGEVGPRAGDTFYTRHGDILPWLGIAAAALTLAVSVAMFVKRTSG